MINLITAFNMIFFFLFNVKTLGAQNYMNNKKGLDLSVK